MHFPLDISENLVYMIIWKKNPSKVDVHSRFTAIPFAVRDFNFHLIVFAKFKHSKHCKQRLHGNFNSSWDNLNKYC